jgi:hypothetical protein
MATMRLQASTASSAIGGDPAPKQAAVDQVAVSYLAKAFIAVDISLNGRNFELKRKLAHGNTAKSQGWCPTFGVQSIM